MNLGGRLGGSFPRPLLPPRRRWQDCVRTSQFVVAAVEDSIVSRLAGPVGRPAARGLRRAASRRCARRDSSSWGVVIAPCPTETSAADSFPRGEGCESVV